MVDKKIVIVINVSLLFIAFLLILNLFDVQISPLGQAAVPREGICVVSFRDQLSLTNDLDRCCLEAVAQLTCSREEIISNFGQTDWICQTGMAGAKILLDNTAHRYCVKQPYY